MRSWALHPLLALPAPGGGVPPRFWEEVGRGATSASPNVDGSRAVVCRRADTRPRVAVAVGDSSGQADFGVAPRPVCVRIASAATPPFRSASAGVRSAPPRLRPRSVRSHPAPEGRGRGGEGRKETLVDLRASSYRSTREGGAHFPFLGPPRPGGRGASEVLGGGGAGRDVCIPERRWVPWGQVSPYGGVAGSTAMGTGSDGGALPWAGAETAQRHLGGDLVSTVRVDVPEASRGLRSPR